MQLIKKSLLLWNSKIHDRVHNIPSLDPYLKLMNSMHKHTPNFFNMHIISGHKCIYIISSLLL